MKKSHGPGHVLVFDCAYPLGTSCFSNPKRTEEETGDHGSIRKKASAAHLL